MTQSTLPTPIRVLVVEDSAFARKVIRESLERARDIAVVGYARDGLDALEKIAELSPDVVTLDLVMPELDGIGVLRALAEQERAASRAHAKFPRVVVVSISDRDSELGAEALQMGAVDIVAKPTALATDRLFELADELIAKVRLAAGARSVFLAETTSTVPAGRGAKIATRTKLIVIGTSTGGPQALTRLLTQLPADLPAAVAIALHIPSGYTESLARRLDEVSPLRVMEASTGLVLRPGMAVLARGGMHLKVNATDDDSDSDSDSDSDTDGDGDSNRNRGKALSCFIDRVPALSLHFPSVDVLFESAVAAAGGGVLGVVLTGMGDDGLAGARAIRAAGGDVVTESAVSCVVYGMPRSVEENGLSTSAVHIDDMAELIVSRLSKPAS